MSKQKRVSLKFRLAALLVVSVAGSLAADDATLLAEKARQIQKRIVAFDSHVDIPLAAGNSSFDAAVEGESQFDLLKTARGGLKGAAVAVFVPQGPRTPEGYAQAVREAERSYGLILNIAEQNPNQAELAYSPADVRRIAAGGKFAVVLSLLNTYPLVTSAPRDFPLNELGQPDVPSPQSDAEQIDKWFRRGVRIVGFVHAGHNDWADSSRPVAGLGDASEEHGGLSDLGKSAVRRLNDLGILVDVSQLSTPALEQVLRLSKAPVVATHSAVKGLVDTSRNLSDEELRLIQKNGGVVQIVAFSNYLRPLPQPYADQVKALLAEFDSAGSKPKPVWPEARRKEFSERYHQIVYGAPPATLGQFVDAIDYTVKKIGVDHVGISSDFNHGGGVAGWQNEGESVNVTGELLRRGYSEADIAKLWGGNFLRVWEQAQHSATLFESRR